MDLKSAVLLVTDTLSVTVNKASRIHLIHDIAYRLSEEDLSAL
jgi:hypothetical protein